MSAMNQGQGEGRLVVGVGDDEVLPVERLTGHVAEVADRGLCDHDVAQVLAVVVLTFLVGTIVAVAMFLAKHTRGGRAR